MMATSGTMAMNPTLYRKLPYEPGKDLDPAALICNVPFAGGQHGAADQIRRRSGQGREGKDQLSYGSGGLGAFHHLMGETFKSISESR